MKMRPTNSISLESCVVPGQVSISDTAWQAVQATLSAFGKQSVPPGSHIVGIYWSNGGTIQRSTSASMEVLTPGIGLGFYRRDALLPEAIHDHNGIECVVVIPKNIIDRAPKKQIDVDEQARRRLVLR